MGITYSAPLAEKRSASGGYMPSTIQKSELEELLSDSEAVAIEGYLQDKQGVLRTAKQQVEVLDIGGTAHSCAGIGDNLFYAYDDGTDTLIKKYDGTTSTTIHTYSGSVAKVIMKRFDDYLYYTNGTKLRVYSSTVDQEIAASPSDTIDFDFYQAYQGGAEFCVVLSSKRIMWSHANDDVTITPFLDWTQVDPPTPTDAYERVYNKGGALQTLVPIDNDLFIGGETNSILMRIQNLVVGTDVQQDNIVTHQSGVGAKKSFAVDNHLFYTVGQEWWHGAVTQGGLQVSNTSLTELLGEAKRSELNFDDAFHFYDRANSIVYLVCRRNSSKNNYMLGYDLKQKTIKEYPYTYLTDTTEYSDQLHGVDSLNGKIVKVFGGFENMGEKVRTRLLTKKMDSGLWTLNLKSIHIKGKLEGLSEINFAIHTWDRDGNIGKTYETVWSDSVTEAAITSSRLSELSQKPMTDITDIDRAFERLFIKNISAYQIEVKTLGFSPHELHNIVVQYAQGGLRVRGKDLSSNL